VARLDEELLQSLAIGGFTDEEAVARNYRPVGK